MHELMVQLNYIEYTETRLQRDLDLLADCYLSNTMHAGLKLSSELEVTYNTILVRLVEIIQCKNKNAHIDMNNIMTYLDYYFN
jgi:hypothetical protein